ncbi:MAG: hypothetical protein P8P48_04085 [Saprospiraceae bacterium]|nr:hypothetical protein [Saprospiraceae bacterium]
MKNLLLISFGLFFLVHSNFAQTATLDNEILLEAKKVAEQCDDIQIWECKKSGNVTFVKSVDDTNGNPQFIQVYFDEDSKSFEQEGEAQKCAASQQEASCSEKVEVTSSSKNNIEQTQAKVETKSCSKSKGSSCCASKKGSKSKAQ